MASTSPTLNDEKRTRMRSPAYPYINLETAIKRAQEFYKEEVRNAAHLKVAVKHWGYEEKSSGGAQTAAALISFGLMSDEGTGESRKVRLTQDALRIILDERGDSTERDQSIKQAALTPKIHRELWKKFEGKLPSDVQLKHTLILEWNPPFNENSVGGFIKEFRDTIRFAKLSESDTLTSEVQDKDGEKGSPGVGVPDIGDYVQWESKGVLQFQEPKQIKGFSGDGKFAFVEGSSTGLPTSELTVKAKAPRPALGLPVIQPSEKSNMRQDIFSLSEGTVTIQWPTPLSTESIQDLKDWLAIVERKIARSVVDDSAKEQTDEK